MKRKTRKYLSLIGIILFLFLLSEYGVRQYGAHGEQHQEQGAFFCTTIYLFFKNHVFGLWELIEHSHDVLIASGTIGLLFVTTGLAYYTLKLWRSTRKLVREAAETSKRELRAYVGLERISYVGNGMGTNRNEFVVKNFGNTPAKDIDMWRLEGQAAGNIATINEENRLLGTYFLQPGQIHTRIEGSDWGPGNLYFLRGAVEYTDIHNDRWRINFAFCHHSDGRFVPHSEYNNEEYLGKASPS